jgi:hypothetical protein
LSALAKGERADLAGGFGEFDNGNGSVTLPLLSFIFTQTN